MTDSNDSIIRTQFKTNEDFLNNKPNPEVYGDDGVITSSVESWKWEKELINIISFLDHTFLNVKETGKTVEISFRLTRDILTGRWDKLDDRFKDFKENFKNYIRKLGSGWKSTRYFYHYIQNVNMINNSYIPDATKTYAMVGIANKMGTSKAVQESLKNGYGYKLKKYYQYHSKRYKNNQWKWNSYLLGSIQPSAIVDVEELLKILPEHKKAYIVNSSLTFQPNSFKKEEFIQKTYGQDLLNQEGDDIDDESINVAGNSIGYRIWISNTVEEDILDLGYAYLDTKPSRLTNLLENETDTVNLINLIRNPFEVSLDETNKEEDSLDKSELEVLANITYIGLENGKHKYHIEEVHRNYIYDKEVIYWLDEEGNTNNEEFKKLVIFNDKVTQKDFNISSSNDNYKGMYRYLGHLPIKDWWSGKDTKTQEVLDLPLDHPLIESQKTIQGLVKELYSDTKEDLSANSSTASRIKPKVDKKNPKKFKFIIDNKEYIKFEGEEISRRIQTGTEVVTVGSDDNSREETKPIYEYFKGKVQSDGTVSINGRIFKGEIITTKRKEARKIQRMLQRRRKIKTIPQNTLMNRVIYSESALRRRLFYLSDLLNIDYVDYVSNLKAQSSWAGGYGNTNTYQSAIMVGAIFTNQTVENAEYWYNWAKHQYKITGQEQSFVNWKASIESGDINSLPQIVHRYSTEDGTIHGGFSYCFIRKLKIKGRVRKIKHKRRIFDILRGKPRTVLIDTLRANPEPYKVLADDVFFESKNGKEYPIGGATFTGSGYTETAEPSILQVLRNYSYTFFAKQSGRNEITCYAVCGLQFTTKLDDKSLWVTAWQDLENEFQRFRAKYIDKKAEEDISIKKELEDGSRKRRHIRQLFNAGIIPVDYNVIKRMNSTSLENFAQRATLNYSWFFVEQKGKRSSMKYIKPVIQIVGFIIAVVLAFPTEGSSLQGYAFAMALLQSIVVATITTVIGTLIVRHLITPLLKALGLKGIIAAIILIVIMITASLLGFGSDTSTLPYASEVTGQIGTQVGNQVGQEAVKQSAIQATSITLNSLVQNVSTQLANQFLGQNIVHTATNAINVLGQAYSELNQEEMAKVQAMYQNDLTDFKKANEELKEMQEELQTQMSIFDTRAVLEALRRNISIEDFDTLYARATDDIGVLASDDYLSMFIESKLNLDLNTFDPIRSTDFTFKGNI